MIIPSSDSCYLTGLTRRPARTHVSFKLVVLPACPTRRRRRWSALRILLGQPRRRQQLARNEALLDPRDRYQPFVRPERRRERTERLVEKEDVVVCRGRLGVLGRRGEMDEFRRRAREQRKDLIAALRFRFLRSE